MLLRPVQDSEDDAELLRSLAVAALSPGNALDGQPPTEATARHRAGRWRERARHLVRTDPAGSWIAEVHEGGRSRPVGAAQSAVREGTWGLMLLAVVPQVRGRGVGKALLERTREYGRGCLRGMIRCSHHPAAARSYVRAGFALHPAVRLEGTLTASGRAGLPPPDGVVEGSGEHRDLTDSVDRLVRGGAHGADHELLRRQSALFVADDFAGSGYCYVDPERGKVELLAATSRRLAVRLLSAALLSLPEGSRASVRGLTAEQQWALDIGVRAELPLEATGFVCVRGMRPPSPYVPSDAFL